MSQEALLGHQRIVPYLHYEDSGAALEYLCRTFGFQERHKMVSDDGSVMHAEVGYKSNVVMFGTLRDAQNKPKDMTKAKELVDRPGSILVYVDDVDAHFARAKTAGAKILAPLEDKSYGDRMYAAVDPEGHQWYFATRMR
jgi:uncharacterized glyoxalase superfamily protein PhnB